MMENEIGFAGEDPLPVELNADQILMGIEETLASEDEPIMLQFARMVSRIIVSIPCNSEYKYMGKDYTMYAKSGGSMITIVLVDNENEDNYRAGSFYIPQDTCIVGLEVGTSILDFIIRTIGQWIRN